MANNVASSIKNMCNTLEQIGQLEFRVRNSISHVALSTNEEFEARYIRDADEAELSLFQPASTTSGGGNQQPHRDLEPGGWVSGPALIRAQPIVEGLSDLKNLPKAHSNPGDVTVTKTYLNAIKKLLEVYPQPRLTEHVMALSRQLETLQGSIADLQNILASMPRTTSGITTTTTTTNKGKKALSEVPKLKKSDQKKARLELQDLIQREQLEILALTDMRDEKRTELRKLSERILKIEIKPNTVLSPKKLKAAKKTPSKTKSILFEAADPFVMSRAESLRRSIQRVKSPRVRHELPSSGLRSMIIDHGDEQNAPQTPTPKPTFHRQIQKNLSQMRSHNDIELDNVQLGAAAASSSSSARKRNIVDVPEQKLLPSSSSSVPLDHPPAITPPSNPVEEDIVHLLPQARLDAVHRLNAAFWKLGTMTEIVLKISGHLELQNGQISYQNTISALQKLVKSYPIENLTTSQLIEAILYYELLTSLSKSPSELIPSSSPSLQSKEEEKVMIYEDEWCVPLERIKKILVKSCEKFAIDVSLNRTVIYFLVGKGVIRIQRRAEPIAICIC